MHPFSKAPHFKFIGNKDPNISDLLELGERPDTYNYFTEIATYMRKIVVDCLRGFLRIYDSRKENCFVIN